MDNKGQIGLPQVLSLVILLFVVFTVGKILFNATPLDPDTSDGGAALNGQGAPTGVAVQNPLTNIGLVAMSAIVIVAAMASIVIRFF